MEKIVVFASGNGSNAEKIIQHFKNSDLANVICVLTNNPHAKIIEKAKYHGINTLIFNKSQLNDGFVLNYLKNLDPDLIVLAGFLLQFPKDIIDSFPNKTINIHPALLPKYGGKGMYGMNVHQAILENKETETGITIHYVTENYDEGAFIFQKAVSIQDCKTPEEVAGKVQELEHQHFPLVVEQLLIK